MRRWLPLIAAPLAASCGSEAAQGRRTAAEDKVECATDGAARFDRVCTVERLSGERGLVLIVRSPSGSFRRLLVTGDGRDVVPADGAEPAIVTPIADNRIEVSIGGDRYRLSATVR